MDPHQGRLEKQLMQRSWNKIVSNISLSLDHTETDGAIKNLSDILFEKFKVAKKSGMTQNDPNSQGVLEDFISYINAS